MAYCRKCGKEIGDTLAFCPYCGAPTGAGEGNGTPKWEQTASGGGKQTEFEEKVKELNHTPDFSSTIDPQDVAQNKLMGVLAYLSWLVLIPIFAAPSSRFARFHANQGLIVAILGTVLGLLSRIPVVGWIFGLLGLIPFALSILGIVNVANGKAKELPVIGGIRILS